METEERKTSLRDVLRLVAAILGVVAIIQELRKPKDEREWHGTVAGVIPYEFRVPTPARFKRTYWDPDGRLLGPKVFGVGWAPNFGVVAGWLGLTGDEPEPVENEPTED